MAKFGLEKGRPKRPSRSKLHIWIEEARNLQNRIVAMIMVGCKKDRLYVPLLYSEKRQCIWHMISLLVFENFALKDEFVSRSCRNARHLHSRELSPSHP